MNESVEMLSAIQEVADELRLLRHFLEFKHGLIGQCTYASMCQDHYLGKMLNDAKNSEKD